MCSDRQPSAPVKVFFALWPDDAVRQALAQWQAELQPHCGGRVMHAGTLHVTLAFVGTIAHERLPQLESAARAVSVQSFELVLDSVQHWEHNHIVYALPSEPPPRLMQLATDLAERLRSSGVTLEERAYRPHVTLLRNACWPDAPLPVLPPVAWRVAAFALMQSLPQHYQSLECFRLDVAGTHSVREVGAQSGVN